VEHKGVYPTIGSKARFLLPSQSLAWDTFFALGSREGRIAALLQVIQQLAWDTLSHLKITDNFAGILMTFYFVHAIRAPGHCLQDILRICRNSCGGQSYTRHAKKSCPDAPFWWLI
jgi:hypothetical protein